jgi:hypothetical protein
VQSTMRETQATIGMTKQILEVAVDERPIAQIAGAASLTSTAGPYGSVARLAQVESDRRWRARYIVVRSRHELVAVLPVHCSELDRFPDQNYDPARAFGDGPSSPREWLLVGGLRDLVAGLLVAPGEVAVRASAAAVASAARLAASEGRRPAIPYLVRDGGHLDVTSRTLVLKEVVTAQACGLSLRPSYPDQLTGRYRSVVRRDLALIRENGLQAEAVLVKNVIDRLAPLIAARNAKYGSPDHALLVRMRLTEWCEVSDVLPVAFQVDCPQLYGASVAFESQGRLYVYEIGVDGDAGKARHAAYVELLLYAPIRYGNNRGLASIDLGLGAVTAKKLRGCSVADSLFVELKPP